MTDDHTTNKSRRVYRVDKFIVPHEAREEFVGRVQKTHQLLRTLPGFMQDFVLEQSDGPGKFNFVTIVEWESSESIAKARDAVMAMHQEMNFSPQEMLSRLEIKIDRADYLRIDD